MIDPLTSLAFSVYSGKGVYALLLGSGISRAAHIPTGWEVTLDLIRKIAAIEGETCDPDPAAWYLKAHGEEPDYSVLLETVALTQAERTNALRTYFEPTEAEREAGEKAPTAAHKAIAKLVSKGYFRVIVTTNFDRLMEQALEAEGINPTVISTADMVKGAVPLAHTDCTIIKVHGDYKDTRLRNTTSELSSYDPGLDKLLDQVFDEYGLIVCGWSATWDYALRASILRSPNRRYSCTWTAVGKPSEVALDVIRFRQATSLTIDSADAFFTSVEAKIQSLEKYNAPHPLSITMAVASLKRFIVDDSYRIELHDLVSEETERQVDSLKGLNVNTPATCETFNERLTTYEASMGILMAIVANGCYWGTRSHSVLWQCTIARVIELSPPQGGMDPFLSLRRYPACILLYAAGVACVASKNYEVLKDIIDLETSIDRPTEGKDSPLITKLDLNYAMSKRTLDQCSNPGRRIWIANERVSQLLREPMRGMLPSDSDYDEAFDRFEYLLSLLLFVQGRGYTPIGKYGANYSSMFPSQTVPVGQSLLNEHAQLGELWGPIEAGIFESSRDFLAIEKDFREKRLSRLEQY